MHGAYSLTVTMTALACNLQNLKPHTNLLRCLVKLTTTGMVKYTKKYAAYRSFQEDVGGLLRGSNVKRSCFYSNSSLGGSLSRLILSMIKALVGEGMRRAERERELTKVGRGQEQGIEGRNTDTKIEGVRRVTREYVREAEVTHALLSISSGLALSRPYISRCLA